MRRSRFTEEQIIRNLREAEAGTKPMELCRRYGISKHTFYAWKAKYDDLLADAARRQKYNQVRPRSALVANHGSVQRLPRVERRL